MRSRLYFDADDSVIWRVYDCTFAAGRLSLVPLGDATATYRVFVRKDGQRRAHKFGPRDARALTEAGLAQQLRTAEFLATEKFDANTLIPERRAE